MEYNKSQFIKSDDKKVLHKVKKQWVVLSMSLLALLGGGAVAHQTVSHADVNHHQSANPETTLKNQINASLTKAQANQNQSATQVSVYNNQQAIPQQISQQANILHNRILQNADLTANSAKPANSNDEQQSNGPAVHSDSTQGRANQNESNQNPRSVDVKPSDKAVKALNKQLTQQNTPANQTKQTSQTQKIDHEPTVGSDQPVTGKWGTASYILNGHHLRVIGGQITRFNDFFEWHPDDPLFQHENQIKTISFSDVQAPTDASAYNDNGFFDSFINNPHSDYSNNNGELFPNQSNLTSIDASGLDTSGTNNMLGMFGNMIHLKALKLGNQFDTSNAKNMQAMFANDQNLSNVDVGNFNTSRVQDMAGMFQYDSSLSSLDVSHFDTSQVTDMANMFRSDNGVPDLAVSHFNTSKVTNMAGMFYDAFGSHSIDFDSDLTTLNLSNWDTSHVTNMSRMFSVAHIKKLILNGRFNTLNVKQIAGMFSVLPIHSIGYSSLDDVVLGSDFRFPNCTNYGQWDYVGNSDGYNNPNNYIGGLGLFQGDTLLSDLDLNNFSSGLDASHLIYGDSDLGNINLSNFYLKGPRILSLKGSSGDSAIVHPGIYNTPGIGSDDVNPYKDYDMLDTSDTQNLVSIKLGPKVTFKKNPQIDPNQNDHQKNYLDGTFYSVTPSDRLITSPSNGGLADGQPHPGTWFRNKGGTSVIVYMDQNGQTVKVASAGSQDSANDLRQYIKNNQNLVPYGYSMPNQNIVVDQDNRNDNRQALSDFIGIVKITPKLTYGTTMIPAEFYKNGSYDHSGKVPVHYSGLMGGQFRASKHQLLPVPSDGGEYVPRSLNPANNLGHIIPTAIQGSDFDFPSNLIWYPNREPTAIYDYDSSAPTINYTEKIPYVYMNQNHQIVDGLHYVNDGQRFSLNSTYTFPNVAPQGYTLDDQNKQINVHDYTTSPADGQTRVVILQVSGQTVDIKAPVTIRLEKNGRYQHQFSDQITLHGRVGSDYSEPVNRVSVNGIPQGYTLQNPNGLLKAEITSNTAYQWIDDGNWDGTDQRPELVYNFTSAAPVTVHYLNAVDGSDVSDVTAPSDYIGATLDLSQNSTFNQQHLPQNCTYDTLTGKNSLLQMTYSNSPQNANVYVDGNIQVRYVSDNGHNRVLGYGRPNLLDNQATIGQQVKAMNNLSNNGLPNGESIDWPDQKYQIIADGNHHYHVNVPVVSDTLWTGYRWGKDQNAAGIKIDPDTDTIYVYGGGYIGYNSSDGSNFHSIFSDTYKVSKGSQNDHTKIGSQMTLPNSHHDWKIIVQNAQFHSAGSQASAGTGYFNGGVGSNGANIKSIDLHGLKNPLPGGASAANMFRDLPSLTNIDGISQLKTDNVFSTAGMFQSDSSLQSLHLGNFNTPKLLYMGSMFRNDTKLKSLNLGHFSASMAASNNHESDVFDFDNQLNKLIIGPLTVLDLNDQASRNIPIFKANVKSDGTANQSVPSSAGTYYAAYPVKVNFKYSNGSISNHLSDYSGTNIYAPKDPDAEYHGKLSDQITSYLSVPSYLTMAPRKQQDYSIQNPNSNNAYVNVLVTINNYNVNVEYDYQGQKLASDNVNGKYGSMINLFNQKKVPFGYKVTSASDDYTVKSDNSDQIINLEPNTAVHFINENTSSDIGSSSQLIVPKDVANQVNGLKLPKGYSLDPVPDHQNYQIYKGQSGQACVNVNLTNDQIWSGYQWGDAGVMIDGSNDTITVYHLDRARAELPYYTASDNPSDLPADQANNSYSDTNNDPSDGNATSSGRRYYVECHFHYSDNNGMAHMQQFYNGDLQSDGSGMYVAYPDDKGNQFDPSVRTREVSDSQGSTVSEISPGIPGLAYYDGNWYGRYQISDGEGSYENAWIQLRPMPPMLATVKSNNQVSGSIFNNIYKRTTTNDHDDPTTLNNQLTQLPNHHHDWTIKVNDGVAPQDSSNLFNGNSNPALSNQVIAINTDGLDTNTNSVNNMSGMFAGNKNLNDLDIDNLNTSKVSDMSKMFQSDQGLSNLSLTHFNTQGVSKFDSMFKSDQALRNLNLSSFNLKNAKNKSDMFDNDNQLNKLILNTQANLSGDNQNWDANFFNDNIEKNGHPSTSDIKGGSQPSDTYYAAERVDVRLIKTDESNQVVDTGQYIETAIDPDADYYPNVQSQLNKARITIPANTHLEPSDLQDYTIHESNGNPYVNLKVTDRSMVTIKYLDQNTHQLLPSVYDIVDSNVPVGSSLTADEIDLKRLNQKTGAQYHLPQNYTYPKVTSVNQTITIPVDPVVKDDKIQFVLSGNNVPSHYVKSTGILASSNFTGDANSYYVFSDGQTNSDVKGLPANYHVAGDQIVPYDGETHQIKIAPNQESGTVNYVYTNRNNQFCILQSFPIFYQYGVQIHVNGRNKISDEVNPNSFITSSDKLVDSNGNLYRLVNQKSSDNRFIFDSDDNVFNVPVNPIVKNVKVQFTLSGSNIPIHYVKSTGVLASGNYTENINSSNSCVFYNGQTKGLPANYHIVGYQTVPYDGAIHQIQIAPNQESGTVNYVYRDQKDNVHTFKSLPISNQYGVLIHVNGRRNVSDEINPDSALTVSDKLTDSYGDHSQLAYQGQNDNQFIFGDNDNTFNVPVTIDNQYWTGYRWGNAGVIIDGSNDTITVNNIKEITKQTNSGNYSFSDLISDQAYSDFGSAMIKMPSYLDEDDPVMHKVMLIPSSNNSNNQLYGEFNVNGMNYWGRLHSDVHIISNNQVNGSIFNNIYKRTTTNDVGDPTSLNQPLTQLPNKHSDWTIKVQGGVAPQDSLNLFNGSGMTRIPSKQIASIDASGLDTTKNHVNNMHGMFADNSHLQNLGINNLDTSNVSGVNSKDQMFDGDDQLNKLTLSSGTNLSNNGQDWGPEFFNGNVSQDGNKSTSDIKNGKQGTNAYYYAEPVDIRLVNVVNNSVIDTKQQLATAISPDSDYHPNVAGQLANTKFSIPAGTSFEPLKNQDYTIQSPKDHPYVNVKVRINGPVKTDKVRFTLIGNNIPKHYQGVVGSLASDNSDYKGAGSYTFSDDVTSSDVKGLPANYHIASNQTIPYDGATHQVQIAPNNENGVVNYVYTDLSGKLHTLKSASISGQYKVQIRISGRKDDSDEVNPGLILNQMDRFKAADGKTYQLVNQGPSDNQLTFNNGQLANTKQNEQDDPSAADYNPSNNVLNVPVEPVGTGKIHVDYFTQIGRQLASDVFNGNDDSDLDSATEYTNASGSHTVNVGDHIASDNPDPQDYQIDKAAMINSDYKFESREQYVTVPLIGKQTADPRDHSKDQSDGNDAVKVNIYLGNSQGSDFQHKYTTIVHLNGQIGSLINFGPSDLLNQQNSNGDNNPLYYGNLKDSDGSEIDLTHYVTNPQYTENSNQQYYLHGNGNQSATLYNTLGGQPTTSAEHPSPATVNFYYDASPDYSSDAQPITVKYFDQHNHPINGKIGDKVVKSDVITPTPSDYGQKINVTNSDSKLTPKSGDSAQGMNVPTGYHLVDNPTVDYRITNRAQEADLHVQGNQRQINGGANSDALPITIVANVYQSNGITPDTQTKDIISDGQGHSEQFSGNVTYKVTPKLVGNIGDSDVISAASYQPQISSNQQMVESTGTNMYNVHFNSAGISVDNVKDPHSQGITFNYKIVDRPTARQRNYIHYISYSDVDNRGDITIQPNHQDFPTEVSDANNVNSKFSDKYYRENVPTGYQFYKIYSVNGDHNQSDASVKSGLTQFGDGNGNPGNEYIEVIPNASPITFHYINQNGSDVKDVRLSGNGSKQTAVNGEGRHTSRFGIQIKASDINKSDQPNNQLGVPQGYQYNALTNSQGQPSAIGETQPVFSRDPQDVYIPVIGKNYGRVNLQFQQNLSDANHHTSNLVSDHVSDAQVGHSYSFYGFNLATPSTGTKDGYTLDYGSHPFKVTVHINPDHSYSFVNPSDNPSGQAQTSSDRGGNVNNISSSQEISFDPGTKAVTNPPKASFWYHVTNNTSKPLTLIYINQAGQQVGCADKLQGTIGSDIDVTDPAKGGEPVPDHYQLDPSQTTQYRFTDQPRTVYLHVQGQPVTSQIMVYTVAQNSDETVTFGHQVRSVSGANGSLISVSPADYYPDEVNDPNKDGSQSKYSIDYSKDSEQFIRLTRNQNGRIVAAPNRIIFYYVHRTTDGAPITLRYINHKTGQEIGYTKVINGNLSDKIDVTNSDPAKGELAGEDVPAGYQIDYNDLSPNNLISGSSKGQPVVYQFSDSPQMLNIPVNGNPETLTYHIHVFKESSDGTIQGPASDVALHITGNVGDTIHISPYGFTSSNAGDNGSDIKSMSDKSVSDDKVHDTGISSYGVPTGGSGYHATNTDLDKDIQINANGQLSPDSNTNYFYRQNYEAQQVGTVRIHYITGTINNGTTFDNTGAPTNNGASQVDMVSDKGTIGNADTFNLDPYRDDVPEELSTNYESANNAMNKDGTQIKDDPNDNQWKYSESTNGFTRGVRDVYIQIKQRGINGTDNGPIIID